MAKVTSRECDVCKKAINIGYFFPVGTLRLEGRNEVDMIHSNARPGDVLPLEGKDVCVTCVDVFLGVAP